MRKTLLRAIPLVLISLVLLGLFASAAWAAPANDSYGSPTVIKGNEITVFGSNSKATTETTEPAFLDGGNGGASVWWKWTATSNGLVTIDTTGSDFQTKLGVYTGSSLMATVTAVATADPVPPATTAVATFTAMKGTEYHIGVAGTMTAPPPDMGNVVLHVSLTPANDMFSMAETIAASPPTATVSAYNGNCTTETGEPVMVAGSSVGKTIWYKWTPTVTGPVTMDTIGSEFDTVLGVYTGSSVGTLTAVSTNDDGFFLNGPSLVSFNTMAGVTYMIQIAGHSVSGVTPMGLFDLNIKAGCVTPMFTPSPGTYTGPKTVTISCPTTGAVIKYTMNGDAPTAASMTYTAGIVLTQNTTLKAKAFNIGFNDSQIASGVYKLRVSVSKPKVTPTTPRHGRKNILISGTITPKVTLNATTLFIERKVGSKYKTYLKIFAKNKASGTMTKYSSAKISLKAGKYRVRARYADTTHVTSLSSYKAFTVK